MRCSVLFPRISKCFSTFRLLPNFRSIHSQYGINLSADKPTSYPISDAEYERVSNKALESLADTFDRLPEIYSLSTDYDVEYAYGVLKVTFGPQVGTYIVNRQAPNKQLWLSSPRSGPRRYDYISSKDIWVYKHDGKSLHELLSEEISEIVGDSVNFHT
ncbi:unnamed protein product [Trichobilharzia szidati]|nr:unnamed protein product [Trichobilharzia szidati]